MFTFSLVYLASFLLKSVKFCIPSVRKNSKKVERVKCLCAAFLICVNYLVNPLVLHMAGTELCLCIRMKKQYFFKF